MKVQSEIILSLITIQCEETITRTIILAGWSGISGGGVQIYWPHAQLGGIE